MGLPLPRRPPEQESSIPNERDNVPPNRCTVGAAAKICTGYFHDPLEQLTLRSTLINHLDRETIAMLQNIIHNNHCFSRSLIAAYEQHGDDNITNVVFVVPHSPAAGRSYDVHSYPEVAAVIQEKTPRWRL
ncbi:unnamed protein product [Absidia cylindrospora]